MNSAVLAKAPPRVLAQKLLSRFETGSPSSSAHLGFFRAALTDLGARNIQERPAPGGGHLVFEAEYDLALSLTRVPGLVVCIDGPNRWALGPFMAPPAARRRQFIQAARAWLSAGFYGNEIETLLAQAASRHAAT